MSRCDGESAYSVFHIPVFFPSVNSAERLSAQIGADRSEEWRSEEGVKERGSEIVI